MALVLLAVFRRALRLLPLMTALAAVAITFGLTAAFGGALTVADVAVFPVLLGLAVDYGVQLRSGTPRGAIAIAALATAAGFLALLVSPVPMVRGFGLLLVVGVVIAFSVAAFTIPDRPARQLSPSRLIPRIAARVGVRRRGDPERVAARADPQPPPRAGARPGACARWLGARRAHAGAVGHHQAGAGEHARAASPRDAGAHNRYLRRGQCARQRAQRDLSQGGQLDGRVRAPDGDPLRRRRIRAIV